MTKTNKGWQNNHEYGAKVLVCLENVQAEDRLNGDLEILVLTRDLPNLYILFAGVRKLQRHNYHPTFCCVVACNINNQ